MSTCRVLRKLRGLLHFCGNEIGKARDGATRAAADRLVGREERHLSSAGEAELFLCGGDFHEAAHQYSVSHLLVDWVRLT